MGMGDAVMPSAVVLKDKRATEHIEDGLLTA